MDKTERSQSIEGRGVYFHLDVNLGPKEGKEHIKRAMSRLAESHLNFVIPLALDTKGGAYYPSTFRKTRLFPDWDPLRVTVDAAREVGLKIYPWFCIFPEGEGVLGGALEQHPDWAMVDKQGQPIGWADPAKLHVRAFEAETIMEVVRDYPIDGVSLDYLRYPNTHDVCYCDFCCSEFRQLYGVDLKEVGQGDSILSINTASYLDFHTLYSRFAHPLLPRWERWKEGNVTAFLKELREQVKAVRPELEISSYFWDIESAYTVCQDWPSWIRQGLLDWANPTLYVYDYRSIRRRCKEYLDVIDGACPTYATVGVHTSHGRIHSAEEVIEQVKVAREEGMDGVVFFTYGALEPYLDEVAEMLFPTKVALPR